jgi:viologen exporter family transport system permease protein
MLNGLQLYLRYVGVSVRAQMQYRVSFALTVVAQMLLTGIEFLGVWMLFDRFGSLAGWRLAEVALFYGMANVAFGLAEGLGRGFNVFSGMVKSGDFDRLLVRPRSTALQVAASQMQAVRIGRIAQGLVVLFWATHALDVDWTFARAALIPLTITGGTCMFVGLFVLSATLSFWSTQSLEVVNCVTYGGVYAAEYPLSIYHRWFRRFFTFVVPLACVCYFPGLAILGRTERFAALHYAAPLAGVLFLIVSLQVWRIGVRHYRSTGS